MTTWQVLGDGVYALGESPFWHPQEQQLYWVDIVGRAVLRANIYMGTVQRWDMPSEPGCIAPAAGGGLVLALRDGVYRARAWGGALELLATLPYDTAVVRANDGKCDALGRFWVGTIDETKAHRAAALYSIDCRSAPAVVQCQARDALTGNGLAFSPDNRTLYWSDTPQHCTYAWDLDLHNNTLSQQRVWHQFAPKPAGWTWQDSGYFGRPDGAAVDVQGNYYAALFEGRRLGQFAPDGRLLHSWETPAQCPTMPCFGGEDLKTLYLTSARHGRSAPELAQFPQSGAVFFRRVEVPGLPVHPFVD